MIRTFACEEVEKIWEGGVSRRFPPDIQKVIRRKLRQLNNAETLADLRIPPANHLEALKGDRRGEHSIRVNSRWRIVFQFMKGEVYGVEMVDYH